MGYYTRTDGEIRIDPPLKWGEIRQSPFREDDGQRWLKILVATREVETDEGVMGVREGVAIVPTTDDEMKIYRPEGDLADILASISPDHTFSGFIQGEGEESGDVWRISVRDHRPHMVKAVLSWPEE